MNNKSLTIGLIVVAIIAIMGVFTPQVQSVTAPLFGGTTNYDQLSLDSTTLPQLKIATGTPVTNGEIVVDGAGTTTLVMMSNASGKGSCIQMESNTGSPVAIYVVGTSVTTAAGTCK